MFFTKKQKRIMKERRRKKKLVGSVEKQGNQTSDGKESKGDPSENKKESNSTKNSAQERKPIEAQELTPDMTNQTMKLNISQVSSNGKKIVVIPSNLDPKQAKKFRKDARRQVRNVGMDDDMIEFVTEGESQQPKDNVNVNGSEKSRPEKKRKRDFPNINQLLEEEQKVAKKRAQEKVESQISDETKDRYRALDCEMVGIGTDGKTSVLARVSLTDWSGNALLDTFVKVPSKVTDFRTKWSGVSAENLKSESAMNVDECRAKVAALLNGKILVGHALKNDLNVLFLSHPKEDIRDTARYRPYQRLVGKKLRPRKLRDLVKEHCDIDIQREGESHDSVEDARAAMELFKVAREVWESEMQRKLKKNPTK